MTEYGPRVPIFRQGRRLGLAFLLLLSLSLVPLPAGADSTGGSFSGYLAYRQSANTNTVWSPLFRLNSDGWTSTIALHNETTSTMQVTARARTFETQSPTTVSFTLAPSNTRLITGSDLNLRDGFNGTISFSGDGKLSAVTYHDNPSANRIALLSSDTTSGNLFIPLAYNQYNGWSSIVSIQNTNPTADTTVKITYRVEGKAAVEKSQQIPHDGGALLDLSSLEKGPLSIQIEASGSTALTAAAYHIRSDGNASANTAVTTGTQKAYVPLLFRKSGFENGFDSGIAVINVNDGGLDASITFIDRDTGDRIGPIPAGTTLRKGEIYIYYLPAITQLADNKVYAAEIEAVSGTGLVAVANHLNINRKTSAVFPAAGRGDSALTVPIVVKNQEGLNTGIQVQNLSGDDSAVTVRFRSLGGTTVEGSTRTYPVPGRSSATIYLPSVAGLPETFSGTAEISSSGGSFAAVANTVRYR
jgi:hypothetical protein